MYVCVTQENLIGITLSKYDWHISIWKNLCLSSSFFFSASSNNQKDAAYMNIKSISPSRISLKNLIIITQVGWNAINTILKNGY
jgi:hypothetical protein